MEEWEPEVDVQVEKKSCMGLLTSLSDKQVKKSPLNSHIAATVNLQFESSLLVCDCSYAVIERCLKKGSPLAWEWNHYRGICSSTGNFLGVQTGKPWTYRLGRIGCKMLEWAKVADFTAPVCRIGFLAQFDVVWCGFLFTVRRDTYMCMHAIDTWHTYTYILWSMYRHTYIHIPILLYVCLCIYIYISQNAPVTFLPMYSLCETRREQWEMVQEIHIVAGHCLSGSVNRGWSGLPSKPTPHLSYLLISLFSALSDCNSNSSLCVRDFP